MEFNELDENRLKSKSPSLRMLCRQLLKAVNQILYGECDETDSKITDICEHIGSIVSPEEPMSRYKASEYLKCSTRQFDRYVESGKIPKGKSIAGFKEVCWVKKDLDKFKASKIKDTQ